MTKTDLVREYIVKYLEIYKSTNRQFSKRYLATVIFNEHPDLFPDIESIRSTIRKILDSSGTASTKNVSIDLELREQFAFLNNPITDTPNIEPFIFPKTNDKILIIADLHSIFYDKEALLAALEYGKKSGVNSVLINGDFLDFYGQSKFNKNPRITAKFIEEEQEWGVEMLSLLQREFGYVVYKAGNHDVRRENQIFMSTLVDPSISTSLSDYLHFDGSTIHFVEDYRIVKMGKLNAIHGHEVGMSGMINPALNIIRKTFDNTISGHSHMKQEYPLKNMDGKLFMSYKVGCLCGLNPRYAPINNWQQGCAKVEIFDDGYFLVDNKIIDKGRIY